MERYCFEHHELTLSVLGVSCGCEEHLRVKILAPKTFGNDVRVQGNPRGAPRNNAMAADDLPGTDEERAEAALIAAPANILGSANGVVRGVSSVAAFATVFPDV